MSKKRNLLFLPLLILSVLILSSCFLNPPVTEGILKGQVLVPEGTLGKDLTGQALPNATINIIDPATGDIIVITVTDSDGYYQISVPPGGPYILEAVKDGVKLQQVTPQVEIGIEYELGTADCTTTAVTLIAQAMMDAGDNLADINLADIEADPNFDEVINSVTSIIEAGGDPTSSAAIEQEVEDFLNPPAPTPLTAIAAITGTPKVGVTLTAGALTPSGATADYQWKICTTSGGTYKNISGATSTTYTAVANDVTKFIKVAATGTGNYSGTVTSDPTIAVAAATVIDILAIPGVTAPVTGAIPVSTIIATDQYTGTVAWTPDNSTFGGATVYTATIMLTAKASYTLTGVSENFFTVAEAVATNNVNSGEVTAVFPETAEVVIGNACGGGKVAYILQSGDLDYVTGQQHGLIAALADQSTGAYWGCFGVSILGAVGTAVGTGKQNTKAILAGCSTSGIAARLCDAYLTIVSEVTYDDWFLPSMDELDKLYDNRTAIGGFDGSCYWSSSEYNAGYAWYQSFDRDFQNPGDKTSASFFWRVRAVRAF